MASKKLDSRIFETTPKQKISETNLRVKKKKLIKELKNIIKDKELEAINEKDVQVIREALEIDIAKDFSILETPECRKEILKMVNDSMLNEDNIGLKLSRFKQIEENLNGIQNGLYLIGGSPNLGKTSFMVNLFIDIIKSNDDCYGIYVSLDDVKQIIFYRMFATAGNGLLSINDYMRPVKVLERIIKIKEENGESKSYYGADIFTSATESILSMADEKFTVFDAKNINNYETLKFHLEKTLKHNIDKKIVVCIDGLFNMEFDGSEDADTRRVNINRANLVKSIVDVYDIPLFATVELRKQDAKYGYKEPILDDINETGKFGYNANLVWFLCFNTLLEVEQDEIPVKLKYGKNKLSSFKGSQYLNFKRANGFFEENNNLKEAYKNMCFPRKEKDARF